MKKQAIIMIVLMAITISGAFAQLSNSRFAEMKNDINLLSDQQKTEIKALLEGGEDGFKVTGQKHDTWKKMTQQRLKQFKEKIDFVEFEEEKLNSFSVFMTVQVYLKNGHIVSSSRHAMEKDTKTELTKKVSEILSDIEKKLKK